MHLLVGMNRDIKVAPEAWPLSLMANAAIKAEGNNKE